MTVFSAKDAKNVEIICLGEALIDRLGPLGGDPLKDMPFQDCLGGAPANSACGLARLGAKVAFVGRLGKDAVGLKFRDLMQSRSIDLSCLQIDSDRPSRVVLVRRDLKGERSFQGFLGDKQKGFADQALDLQSISENWSSIAKSASWLVIGTIPLASPLSAESLLWVINKACTDGLKIALDINWRPTFWDKGLEPNSGPNKFALDTIKPILERVSLLKLSKEEAELFFNSDDPKFISFSLPQKPDVVLTDGSMPIKWALGNFTGELNPISPDLVVDTTGAGDSFLSGLIFKTLRSSSDSYDQYLENLRFAAACGAYVCSGAGAIEPQPHYSEVIDFLASRDGGSI